MHLRIVALLLVASNYALAEYLAYSVAQGGRSPLPERLEKIDAKHLLNVEWGEFAGKKIRVGVLEVDNNSATSSFKVTDSTGATYESEWNLSGGTVPVNGIEAIVTDTMNRTGRFRRVERAARGEIPVQELFYDDGIAHLTKAQGEVLTAIEIPPQGDARSVYRKVSRRGSFDFPVAAVAVRLTLDGDRVREVRIVLNAVGSAPVESSAAEAFLVGKRLDDDVIAEAATLAYRPAKPLDNTDHHHTWRKQRVRVEVKRALQGLRAAFANANPASGAA